MWSWCRSGLLNTRPLENVPGRKQTIVVTIQKLKGSEPKVRQTMVELKTKKKRLGAGKVWGGRGKGMGGEGSNGAGTLGTFVLRG